MSRIILSDGTPVSDISFTYNEVSAPPRMLMSDDIDNTELWYDQFENLNFYEPYRFYLKGTLVNDSLWTNKTTITLPKKSEVTMPPGAEEVGMTEQMFLMQGFSSKLFTVAELISSPKIAWIKFDNYGFTKAPLCSEEDTDFTIGLGAFSALYEPDMDQYIPHVSGGEFIRFANNGDLLIVVNGSTVVRTIPRADVESLQIGLGSGLNGVEIIISDDLDTRYSLLSSAEMSASSEVNGFPTYSLCYFMSRLLDDSETETATLSVVEGPEVTGYSQLGSSKKDIVDISAMEEGKPYSLSTEETIVYYGSESFGPGDIIERSGSSLTLTDSSKYQIINKAAASSFNKADNVIKDFTPSIEVVELPLEFAPKGAENLPTDNITKELASLIHPDSGLYIFNANYNNSGVGNKLIPKKSTELRWEGWEENPNQNNMAKEFTFINTDLVEVAKMGSHVYETIWFSIDKFPSGPLSYDDNLSSSSGDWSINLGWFFFYEPPGYGEKLFPYAQASIGLASDGNGGVKVAWSGSDYILFTIPAAQLPNVKLGVGLFDDGVKLIRSDTEGTYDWPNSSYIGMYTSQYNFYACGYTHYEASADFNTGDIEISVIKEDPVGKFVTNIRSSETTGPIPNGLKNSLVEVAGLSEPVKMPGGPIVKNGDVLFIKTDGTVRVVNSAAGLTLSSAGWEFKTSGNVYEGDSPWLTENVEVTSLPFNVPNDNGSDGSGSGTSSRIANYDYPADPFAFGKSTTTAGTQAGIGESKAVIFATFTGMELLNVPLDGECRLDTTLEIRTDNGSQDYFYTRMRLFFLTKVANDNNVYLSLPTSNNGEHTGVIINSTDSITISMGYEEYPLSSYHNYAIGITVLDSNGSVKYSTNTTGRIEYTNGNMSTSFFNNPNWITSLSIAYTLWKENSFPETITAKGEVLFYDARSISSDIVLPSSLIDPDPAYYGLNCVPYIETSPAIGSPLLADRIVKLDLAEDIGLGDKVLKVGTLWYFDSDGLPAKPLTYTPETVSGTMAEKNFGEGPNEFRNNLQTEAMVDGMVQFAIVDKVDRDSLFKPISINEHRISPFGLGFRDYFRSVDVPTGPNATGNVFGEPRAHNLPVQFTDTFGAIAFHKNAEGGIYGPLFPTNEVYNFDQELLDHGEIVVPLSLPEGSAFINRGSRILIECVGMSSTEINNLTPINHEGIDLEWAFSNSTSSSYNGLAIHIELRDHNDNGFLELYWLVRRTRDDNIGSPERDYDDYSNLPRKVEKTAIAQDLITEGLYNILLKVGIGFIEVHFPKSNITIRQILMYGPYGFSTSQGKPIPIKPINFYMELDRYEQYQLQKGRLFTFGNYIDPALYPADFRPKTYLPSKFLSEPNVVDVAGLSDRTIDHVFNHYNTVFSVNEFVTYNLKMIHPDGSVYTYNTGTTTEYPEPHLALTLSDVNFLVEGQTITIDPPKNYDILINFKFSIPELVEEITGNVYSSGMHGPATISRKDGKLSIQWTKSADKVLPTIPCPYIESPFPEYDGGFTFGREFVGDGSEVASINVDEHDIFQGYLTYGIMDNRSERVRAFKLMSSVGNEAAADGKANVLNVYAVVSGVPHLIYSKSGYWWDDVIIDGMDVYVTGSEDRLITIDKYDSLRLRFELLDPNGSPNITLRPMGYHFSLVSPSPSSDYVYTEWAQLDTMEIRREKSELYKELREAKAVLAKLQVVPVEVSDTTYTLGVNDKDLVFTNPAGCTVTVPYGFPDDYKCVVSSETDGDVDFVKGNMADLTNYDNEFKLAGNGATAVIYRKLTAGQYKLVGRTKL